jgi:hypothetical protein
MVRVQGKLRDFFIMQVALYNITVVCDVVRLKPASGGPLRTFDLTPGAPSINFEVQDFLQTPNCGSDLRYDLTNPDGTPVDSAYARFEEKLDPTFGRWTRRVYLQAPFDSGEKQVNLKVLAYGPG